MMKLKKKTRKKTRLWEHIPEFLWNLWLTTFIGKRNNKTLRFGGTNADTFENFGNFFIPQKLWNVNDNLDIKLTDVIKFAPQGVPCRFFFSAWTVIDFFFSEFRGKSIKKLWTFEFLRKQKLNRKKRTNKMFLFQQNHSSDRKNLFFIWFP